MNTGDKMVYQSLYRKYRPKHLDEVVGQKHILEVLNNSLKKDMISHAYLFCGPRGTGKTSIAKLFAQSINCETSDEIACGNCDNCIEGKAGTHPDIVEIDAASNNGVEEIRNLIDRIKYTPLLGKYKVYIIDEVHMLSAGAFNAFLKTLEEPPEHAVFVLATTEIHKVIPTIVSRCQRFDFNNLSDSAIKSRLDYILVKENVDAEEDVTQLIASLSNGALRNALTILEQAIIVANPVITLQQVNDLNGVVTPRQKYSLIQSLLGDDMNRLNSEITVLLDNAVDIERLTMDLVNTIKDTVVYQYTKSVEHVRYSEQSLVEFLAPRVGTKTLLNMIETLLEYIERMKFSHNQAAYLQIALIKLFNLSNEGVATVDSEIRPSNVVLKTDFTKEIPNVKSQSVNESTSKPIIEESPTKVVQSIVESKSESVVVDEMVDEPVHIIKQSSIDPVITHVEREYSEDPLQNGIVESTNSKQDVVLSALAEQEDIEEAYDHSIHEYIFDEPIEEPLASNEQLVPEPSVIDNSPLISEKVADVSTVIQDTPQVPVETEGNSYIKPVSQELSIDQIVQYMVSANKDLRMIDEVNFKNVSTYINSLEWAKCARLIIHGNLSLSSDHFIMISMDDELQVKEIMEPSNNIELLKFSEIIFNTDKRIYATTKETFTAAVMKFRELSKTGNLPSPLTEEDINIKNDQQEVQERDIKKEKVLELFGSNVNIIE